MTIATTVPTVDLSAYYDQATRIAVGHPEIAVRGPSTCNYTGSLAEFHGPAVFLGDCCCTACKGLDLLDRARCLAIAVPTESMDYQLLVHVSVESLNLRQRAREARLSRR